MVTRQTKAAIGAAIIALSGAPSAVKAALTPEETAQIQVLSERNQIEEFTREVKQLRDEIDNLEIYVIDGVARKFEDGAPLDEHVKRFVGRAAEARNKIYTIQEQYGVGARDLLNHLMTTLEKCVGRYLQVNVFDAKKGTPGHDVPKEFFAKDYLKKGKAVLKASLQATAKGEITYEDAVDHMRSESELLQSIDQTKLQAALDMIGLLEDIKKFASDYGVSVESKKNLPYLKGFVARMQAEIQAVDRVFEVLDIIKAERALEGE